MSGFVELEYSNYCVNKCTKQNKTKLNEKMNISNFLLSKKSFLKN